MLQSARQPPRWSSNWFTTRFTSGTEAAICWPESERPGIAILRHHERLLRALRAPEIVHFAVIMQAPPTHRDILTALEKANRVLVTARGRNPDKPAYQNCKLAIAMVTGCRENIERLTDSPADAHAARNILEHAHVALALMQSGEAAASVKVARQFIETLLETMPPGGVIPE